MAETNSCKSAAPSTSTRMQKRVTTKEDGRVLIYYTFEGTPEPASPKEKAVTK